MTSSHLEDLIAHNHGSAHLQVVFVDVVGYLKRRRSTRFAVIREFTSLVNASLVKLREKYSGCAEPRPADFTQDVVRLATGRGLAVVFAFDSLPDAAADFAAGLREAVDQRNRQVECEYFSRAGWCHCHTCFEIAIEICQGQGTIYREVNDSYCVTDSTIDFERRSLAHAATASLQRLQWPVLHLEL